MKKTTVFLSVIIFFTFLSNVALAQPRKKYASINVTVFEKPGKGTEKIPLDSAFVEVYSKRTLVATGWTNKIGVLIFDNLKVGSFLLKTSKKGYKDVQINDIKTSEGKMVYVTLDMTKNPVKKKGIRLVPVE